MDLKLVLRKSLQGQDEIKTRSRGLSTHLRMLLIFINGEINIGELHQKLSLMPSYGGIKQLTADIDKLLENGLVEDTSNTIRFKKADYGAVAWTDDQVFMLKDELITLATEVLGGSASKVTSKIENATGNRDGVVKAIDDSVKFVRLFIDEKKADELATRCRASIAHFHEKIIMMSLDDEVDSETTVTKYRRR